MRARRDVSRAIVLRPPGGVGDGVPHPALRHELDDGDERGADAGADDRRPAARVARGDVLGHVIGGGALVGLGGMVRPMACFAAGGGVLRLLLDRRDAPCRRIVTGLAFGLAAAAAFGAGRGRSASGAAMPQSAKAQSFVAYGGRIVDWPFSSLIAGYMVYGVLSARGLYMGAHLIVAVAAWAMAVAARDVCAVTT